MFYTNTTGRNDIVDAKVARDRRYVYFYVETADKLTPSTDRNWMMLFIDVDRDKATGWEGYDFVLNYEKPQDGKSVLSRHSGDGWNWEARRGRRIMPSTATGWRFGYRVRCLASSESR